MTDEPETKQPEAEAVTEVKPEETPAKEPKEEPKVGRKHRWLAKYKSHKKVSIPLTILAVLGLLLLIPVTRYPLAGLALKKDFSMQITDSKTSRPVSGARVTLAGKSGETDGNGWVTLKSVKVGYSQAAITKQNYHDRSVKVLVPIGKANQAALSFEASGRQVPTVVLNKITGDPIKNATIKAASGEFKTDDKGEASLVLPANITEFEATISASGFNDNKAPVVLTEDTPGTTTLTLTPVGKLYFLSKLSGKVDVVKTDLDGKNRQTVLAGTGKEVDYDTILLASRDWKYLALKSRRDGSQTKLHLIDTTDGDKVSTIDEGDAVFNMTGWYNNKFMYEVVRSKLNSWQPKREALKLFDASTKKLTTIDESDAAGSGVYNWAYESIRDIFILENQAVYTKEWQQSNNYTNDGSRKSRIISVNLSNNTKKTLKEFPATATNYAYGISGSLYAPQEIYYTAYFSVFNNTENTPHYYEYGDGKFEELAKASEDTPYITYLLSPSGKKTFWTESRDGLNLPLIGDNNGKQGNVISSGGQQVAYGWYTDDYILMSNGGSELFIGGTAQGSPLLKVSDYHKPSFNSSGYGYGYGGF